MKVALFWFRRDLRLEDNTALNQVLKSGFTVLPIFIFDKEIISELPKNDARVNFIHQTLKKINTQLQGNASSLKILLAKPMEAFRELIKEYNVVKVYCNKDYEPYAIKRDKDIKSFLNSNNIEFHDFKDQVIFEENEITKDDGKPYTIYTPFKNKWLQKFSKEVHLPQVLSDGSFIKEEYSFPSIEEIGFSQSQIKVKPFTLSNLKKYSTTRDIPEEDGTSYLSPHLRFGTISPRQIIKKLGKDDSIFLSELIWREFFMQILFHFPKVVSENFKAKYNGIKWRNNEEEFEKWCEGKTGYPMVDAGMRQLNQTGYMHNRERMVTAGFLCKHLLIDWKWGEAYFAKKLLDYDLSANNGNWQWSAGTGCDSAPYFRIFNPSEQIKKFDSKFNYIKKWIPEFGQLDYPNPMVDHKYARERALTTYKEGIENA